MYDTACLTCRGEGNVRGRGCPIQAAVGRMYLTGRVDTVAPQAAGDGVHGGPVEDVGATGEAVSWRRGVTYADTVSCETRTVSVWIGVQGGVLNCVGFGGAGGGRVVGDAVSAAGGESFL